MFQSAIILVLCGCVRVRMHEAKAAAVLNLSFCIPLSELWNWPKLYPKQNRSFLIHISQAVQHAFFRIHSGSSGLAGAPSRLRSSDMFWSHALRVKLRSWAPRGSFVKHGMQACDRVQDTRTSIKLTNIEWQNWSLKKGPQHLGKFHQWNKRWSLPSCKCAAAMLALRVRYG